MTGRTIEGLKHILSKEDFETFVKLILENNKIELEYRKPILLRLFGEQNNNPIFSREQFSQEELSGLFNLVLGAFGSEKHAEMFDEAKEEWRRIKK